MEKHLHIICLDTPYPVNYGGVVDLYNKIVALHQQGISIYLHCFSKEIIEQPILKNYCKEVYYYQRKSLQAMFSTKPYIVASRDNKDLEKRLQQDDFPIFCEGVHTTNILFNTLFKERKIIVRLHNVEQHYYHHLFKNTNNIFKKIYFFLEKNKLKNYEQNLLQKQIPFFTVTQADADFYRNTYKNNHVNYLPIFINNNWIVNNKNGINNYCLYNGDLSISVNVKAVQWLIENVLSEIQNINFKIAGKNPSNEIIKVVKKYNNIELLANVSQEKMEHLIANAQINLLPSTSNAGIKLKLLNALFNGRFCIVNNETIAGSDLQNLCFVANTKEEWKKYILHLINKEFSTTEFEKRKSVLMNIFNNQQNAQTLINAIF